MMRKIDILTLMMFLCLLLSAQVLAGQNNGGGLGLTTVVIDPGHGGKDPGAPGQTASTAEKHLVLSVSKLFGEKIKAAYPGLKVIYTRSTDKFIGLHDRAMVARNNDADLFISIHCNSNSDKSAKGSSVHILGQKSDRKSNTTDYFEKNMSVAQRENEVIIMEEGYETRYKHFDPNTPEAYIGYALQWKAHYESSLLFAAEVVDKLMKAPLQPRRIPIDQDVFQVLVEANMPAVLLELAFISNSAEYKYLASKSGQEEIAERLFQAFKAYKTQYDGSMNVSVAEQLPQPAPAADAQAEPAAKEYYTIQIMSSGKLLKQNDPALKGLNAHTYRMEGSSLYKYLVGRHATKDEASRQLSQVRKYFPEAFVTRIIEN